MLLLIFILIKFQRGQCFIFFSLFVCFLAYVGIGVFWLILEGVKVGLFTPGEAFEVVARRRIQKLKEPATKIVSLVSEEIKIVFHSGLAKVGRGKGLSRTLNLLRAASLGCILVKRTSTLSGTPCRAFLCFVR